MNKRIQGSLQQKCCTLAPLGQLHLKWFFYNFSVIGVIFYGVLVFLSNRARLAIILHTLAFHKNPISRADIEMLYEKLSTINPDPNIQRALLENKAHMNSLIASIEHAKKAQTSGSSAQGMDLNDTFKKIFKLMRN